MGALCSYGRSDKLDNIERARSVGAAQFPDSVTRNNLFLTKRQQSRLISGVQLQSLQNTSQRWINAGIDKVDLSEIVSSADQPVPDHVTFRNSPGFFPRLLEDVTHARTDISRLGLLPGVTWSSYVTFFHELLLSTQQQQLQQQQQQQHASHRHIIPQEQVKTLYFVRHGEATHNVAEEQLGGQRWESVEALSEEYFDPPLTEYGIQQMSNLEANLSHAIQHQGLMVDCILVSPLIRAIESAQIAFAQIWNKVPIICVENARETLGVHTCDRRRTKAELKQRYPTIIFDLLTDGVDPLWHSGSRETDLERLQRAARLVNFLFTLPYKYIAVVSHGGIIRAATTVLMAEVQECVEWRATCLSSSPIYGYQLDKGEMLPVCAHRRTLHTTNPHPRTGPGPGPGPGPAAQAQAGTHSGDGSGSGSRSGSIRGASRTITQQQQEEAEEPELSLSQSTQQTN